MRRGKTEKIQNSKSFSKVKYQHSNPVESGDYANVYKYNIYVVMKLTKSTKLKTVN